MVVFTHAKADRWAHYSLKGSSYTPRTCAYEKIIDRRCLIDDPPAGTSVSDAAEALLAAVGLVEPAPPNCSE
jgi:hypothetical protein